ncbi:MAG: hypothetical protein ACRDFA_08705 [bacterium]|jgi:hypothetical protein
MVNERQSDLPHLLFVERTALAEPITVEMDRPMALHPKVAGFWRNGEFARVLKIVDTRYEHGEIHLRVVTDRGCYDLRRFRRPKSQTLRMDSTWELCAELDTVELSYRG